MSATLFATINLADIPNRQCHQDNARWRLVLYTLAADSTASRPKNVLLGLLSLCDTVVLYSLADVSIVLGRKRCTAMPAAKRVCAAAALRTVCCSEN